MKPTNNCFLYFTNTEYRTRAEEKMDLLNYEKYVINLLPLIYKREKV